MRDRVLPQIRQCVILCQKGDARFALALFGGKCGGQAGGVFAYRKSVFLQKVFKGRSALGFLPRCFGVGKNGIGKPVEYHPAFLYGWLKSRSFSAKIASV